MTQSSAFTVNLDLALSGKGAPPRPAYDAALARSAAALDWLRQQHASQGAGAAGHPGAHRRSEGGRQAGRGAEGLCHHRGAGHRRFQPGRPGADRAAQGAKALCRIPRQSRSLHLGEVAQALRSEEDPFHRHLEIRRHRRDPDAGADRGGRAGKGGREIAQEAFHHHHRTASERAGAISPTASAR